MNFLAVDFGTKNIGLAWCNSALGVVLPYGIIKNSSAELAVKELSLLITKENIDKVVFGLPLGVGGSGERNMNRVKDFVDKLKQKISVPVDFFDERFSSQQADRMGGEASRDEKSAMIILESYLESKNNLTM